jgi:hypothetical protein
MPDRDEFIRVTPKGRRACQALEAALAGAPLDDTAVVALLESLWRASRGIATLKPVLAVLERASGEGVASALDPADDRLDRVEETVRRHARSLLDIHWARSASQSLLAGELDPREVVTSFAVRLVIAHALEGRGSRPGGDPSDAAGATIGGLMGRSGADEGFGEAGGRRRWSAPEYHAEEERVWALLRPVVAPTAARWIEGVPREPTIGIDDDLLAGDRG